MLHYKCLFTVKIHDLSRVIYILKNKMWLQSLYLFTVKIYMMHTYQE